MKVGDILLVKFPFSDLESSKKRPVLCLRKISLSSKVSLFTIAMITSQIEGLRIEGDVLLLDWKNEGLLHPSLVRLCKIATVEDALIERRIGSISTADLKKVKTTFREVFRPWI